MTVAGGTEILRSSMKPSVGDHDGDAHVGHDVDCDAAYGLADAADVATKPKKKRRVIKTPDKKYQCSAEDCGKSYSRAEHLYRHQLNHAPKQIYRCDFPGCDRHFVRADLCARHKERHTAKGSHLQRKDAFMQTQRTHSVAAANKDHNDPNTAHHQAPAQSLGPMQPNRFEHAISNGGNTYVAASSSPEAFDNDATTAARHRPVSRVNSSTESYASNLPPRRLSTHSSPQIMFRNHNLPAHSALHPESATSMDSRMSSTDRTGFHTYSSIDTSGSHQMQPAVDGTYTYGSVYGDRTTTGLPPSNVLTLNPSGSDASSRQPQQTDYPHQQHPMPYTSMSSLRSPQAYSSLQSVGYNMSSSYGPTSEPGMVHGQFSNDLTTGQMMDGAMLDPGVFVNAMPVFGGDGFSRSPSVIMDDQFLNIFFTMNSGNLDAMQPSPPAGEPSYSGNRTFPGVFTKQEDMHDTGHEAEVNDRGNDGAPTTLDALDINLRESMISEHKQSRLLNLVQGWVPIENNFGRKDKEEILDGDISRSTHVMSLHMLKTYIASYWANIHCQMPILHRPTFNPETCPDLLVLAMACLGATCLERTHSTEQTTACAELAFFIAHHIRWEVFKDAEFRPTAKLWTFQTMLLLELFEKMYSTRALHERAHIHHATTLTVMRRGSSLIGRSATEATHKSSDPTRTPPGPDGTINTSGQNTADAFWNRWITAEATRRVAFAAFIIDSTHATLFGHSAAMSPHDLRLPLPCDEALWSATSSAEVQRVEASLAANGFKTTTFLDGLKKTLNGQKVRTNTFGRVALMSGLLNISWHMNQRDLQVSSLGAANTLGSQIRWRSPLTRAFDFWRRDFDESLTKSDHLLQVCHHRPNDRDGTGHRDHVFESRTCLHSLAHMAMHVDITDCLVFAGSDHVLGRAVTDSDRVVVQRRMRDQWAPSARARDAAFYALRFLSEVLIPEEELATKRDPEQQTPIFHYSARDDYLLNRPWVLYFALLIVWSYGYALDGSLPYSAHKLNSRHTQIEDMQRYLIRAGGVASPDDLEKLADRNECLGLLLLLQESFRQPRWELLQDANAVLGSCIGLLLKTTSSDNNRKHLTGV